MLFWYVCYHVHADLLILFAYNDSYIKSLYIMLQLCVLFQSSCLWRISFVHQLHTTIAEYLFIRTKAFQPATL